MRALLLLLAGLCACASLPKFEPGPPPPATPRWLQQVDWPRADQEIVAVLQAYLRVDTTNPPGNETAGAQHLGALLQAEGIPYEIHEFAPGRGSLVARLKGSGVEAPLCLLSHIDVVTAESAKWPQGKGPLSGALDGGYLWGRGALDMKGMGALEVMTLVWLRRLQVPLRRDVIVLAVADEEVGNQGIQHLVQKHWQSIGCSHVVNEGGIGVRDMLTPGQTVFAVSVAEKGLLWLKMTAHGKSGHGSTPMPGRAPGRLLDALQKIRALEPEPHVHASLYQAFAQAGHASGGLQGFVLRRPTLVDWLALDRLMAEPGGRAAVTDTCNVTGFAGMHEPNVVPSEVSATLDCRLLPGTTPAQMLQKLKDLIADPQVDFQILHAAVATESPWDDPFYRALVRHVTAGRPDVVAGPVLSVGYTDSIALRPLGVRAYGLVPIEVSRQEAETMHGENERVPVESLQRGLRVLLGAVLDVAAQPGEGRPSAGALHGGLWNAAPQFGAVR